jgi:hypothetical protein
MNLEQCRKKAIDANAADRAEFVLVNRQGLRSRCRWEDADMGIFRVLDRPKHLKGQLLSTRLYQDDDVLTVEEFDPDPGWALTFKFAGGGVHVELEYAGGDQAIRAGIGLTWTTLGRQLTEKLGEGRLPEALGQEALMLSAIQGGAPLTAYEGKYLRIAPAAAGSGLTMTAHVEW